MPLPWSLSSNLGLVLPLGSSLLAAQIPGQLEVAKPTARKLKTRGVGPQIKTH